MEPVFVSVWPEAGRMLGVGRSTVWKLVWSGDLLSVWVGGRRLVPVDAIRQYAKDQVAAAASAA